MKIAIITINGPSLKSAKRLLPTLSAYENIVFNKSDSSDGFKVYKKLDDILSTAFNEFDALIFIMATGAVVRKIAPYLKDKASDPAVVVINLELNRVLPLLSGHLGGANELAKLLEKKLPGCINFITTATDQTDTLAFDMLAKKRGWRVKNLKSLANISNKLLNNKNASLRLAYLI